MKIAFLSPVDGDVLTPLDGREENESLIVPVIVKAPVGSVVTVNGIPAVVNDSVYTAPVKLDGYRNTVVARAEKDGETAEAKIALYRFKNAFMKYRLSVDDVIWSLEEIAGGAYRSLFDHPFFAIFKRLHEDFGTQIHMNLFYETEDGGFNLTMMPDTYKSEFETASDWLKFTFHARANKPDRIYRFAPYEELYGDYQKVTREIVRFAGENAVKSAAMGLHWGETTREGARALRAVGIRCLLGYFRFDKDGEPFVSYYLNREQTAHAAGRDFWVDTSEGIIFSKDKFVIDRHTVEGIPPALDDLRSRPHEAGTINFLVHEQFFYPHYPKYLPDYEERIRTAIQWAHDNRYAPVLLDEAIAEDMALDFLK
ncbi:MAG: hypothetical protein IKB87_04570 [Clostridia bacterium]|nr:hypothetical protein [Clostridia bacterium]